MADIKHEEDNKYLRYRGIALSTSVQVFLQFNKVFSATLQSILKCTEARFMSFSEDEVLLAAEVLDPANHPNESDKRTALLWC